MYKYIIVAELVYYLRENFCKVPIFNSNCRRFTCWNSLKDSKVPVCETENVMSQSGL